MFDHLKNGKFFAISSLLSCLFLPLPALSDEDRDPLFHFPVECQLGETCFLQNLFDHDPGDGISDSLCQGATYNNHKGIDVRVRTLADLEDGIKVTAISDGIVAGVRDSLPDRILHDVAELQTVKGRECGNGVFINHADGWSSQYCHMKLGSVNVKKGDKVKRGDFLGHMGASGATQFPHLDFTLRRNNVLVDPLSGFSQSPQNCKASAAEILENGKLLPFGRSTTEDLLNSFSTVLDLGFSGKLVSLKDVSTGLKDYAAKRGDEVTLGWGWFINLRKGDQVEVQVMKDGKDYSVNLSEPFDRNKAQWFLISGRKRQLEPGNYLISAAIIRDGSPVSQLSRHFTVE